MRRTMLMILDLQQRIQRRLDELRTVDSKWDSTNETAG
jgi:hypothetical protein